MQSEHTAYNINHKNAINYMQKICPLRGHLLILFVEYLTKKLKFCNSEEQSHSGKASRCSAVSRFSKFYGTRIFITAFTSSRHLSRSSPVHASASHILKIHFNIILISSPRFSSWSVSIMSPHQNPVCTFPILQTLHMPHPSYSSLINKLCRELIIL